MRKIPAAVLFLGLALALSGPAWAQGKKAKPEKLPEASGEALWDYLKNQDYQKKWEMWPGKKALYQGTEPHGALLTTYVNQTALKGIKAKKGTLPDGSIVAKQNYAPDKTYKALTVMYKVKGYNPDGGNWFWAKYSPEGKVEAAGKVEGCINCHGKNRTNDYVMTGPPLK